MIIFMTQREKMKNDLLKEIDRYFMNLVYLKDLIKVEEHMTQLQELNELAPNFNLIVQCGLIDSYMLCLMKLYDKSSKAKTIPKLIQKCKEDLHLFCDSDEVAKKLSYFEGKLQSDEYIIHAIEILRERRDQYHVHNDKKYFGEKIVNDTSHLPMYYIWFLRDFTEDVLQYLWSQLSSEACRKEKYDKDLNNLFQNR